MKKNGATQYKRYYCGNTELTYDGTNNIISEIDYIYAGEQLVAMYTNLPNPGGGTISGFYRVHSDYQNTVRAVSSFYSSEFYYQSFDAWGNYRQCDRFNSPSILGDIAYEKPSIIAAWISRGYTSHEHLPEFRLINMNARLYDPHVARMLTPDNYMTANSLQGLNRYSYAHNNPGKYVDADGNFPWIPVAVGAVVGAYFGGVTANKDVSPPQNSYSLKH